jgi:hypothetical protein
VECQQPRDQRRIGSNEAQPIMAIMAQEPTHREIAEAALAIEDDEQPVTDVVKFAHA